jgi:hypothetical protein
MTAGNKCGEARTVYNWREWAERLTRTSQGVPRWERWQALVPRYRRGIQASEQDEAFWRDVMKLYLRPEAPPLSAYVGKHPTEPVQGVTFFQHPDVRAAIVASGVDRDIQKSIVFDGNVVGVATATRGRLLLHGYDPAGAGSTNWAILMIPDGSKAAVCYSTGIVGYEKGADWYFEGDVAFTLYTPCPSEEGDMESLSNWPIGPIPG